MVGQTSAVTLSLGESYIGLGKSHIGQGKSHIGKCCPGRGMYGRADIVRRYAMIRPTMLWHDLLCYDMTRYDTLHYDMTRYDTLRYDRI